MAQVQSRKSFVAIISGIVFLIFFLQMLFVGQTIVMSLLFASLMGVLSAGLGSLSYAYKEFLQRRSFAGKKQANQTISNHQQRSVEIDMPINLAFDLALSALKTLDRQPVPMPDDILIKLESVFPRKQYLRIRESNREKGVIKAGLTARTLGLPEIIDFSRITLHLQEVDATTTRIHIESKANTLFDMYDLGKNLHYVNQIALYLRRERQHLVAKSRLSDTQSDEMHKDNTDDSAHLTYSQE